MGSHTNHATQLKDMIDSRAKLIMIGKQLPKTLGLANANLESCLFTILTLVRGTKLVKVASTQACKCEPIIP